MKIKNSFIIINKAVRQGTMPGQEFWLRIETQILQTIVFKLGDLCKGVG